MLALHGFLTADERRALKAVLHRAGHSAQEHGRANAILLIDGGVPIPLIAKLLFLDEQSIRNFLERYQLVKIDALLDNHYRGKQSKLTSEEKDRLRQHVAENPYMDRALVTAYILPEFGKQYSRSGTHRLLHELGFVYKKPKHVPGKADAVRRAEFALRLQELMAQKSPGARVYFMDATHPQYNSVPAYGWILKGADKELPANCGRQRLNLNGAIDAESHEATVINSPTIDADSTLELLGRMEATNPEAESIYVVCGNAAYYHSRKVTEYLSSSRISLVFLPPYSPNLNLIERLWKFFRREVANNRFYSSFAEFTEQSLFFFECLSEHADRLKSLLTFNFQLLNKHANKRVAYAG